MADFQTLYIYEAHTSDDALENPKVNLAEGVCYLRPRTMADRLVIARDFVSRTKWDIPMVLDTVDDHLATQCGLHGTPNALFVVEDGRVTFTQANNQANDSPELTRFLEQRFPQLARSGR